MGKTFHFEIDSMHSQCFPKIMNLNCLLLCSISLALFFGKQVSDESLGPRRAKHRAKKNEAIRANFDRYGIILRPSYGKRIGHSNTFEVQSAGRLSTSAIRPENTKVVDDTGYVRVPEYYSMRANFKARKDYFKTYAISHLSFPLVFEGVQNFERTIINTGANGTFHTSTVVTMPETMSQGSTARYVTFSIRGYPVKNNAYLAEEEGYSIISDIDDTIKDTRVLSFREVFIRTFLMKFSAIPGMPEYYKSLAAGLVEISNGYQSTPTFHYLSGIPYQFVGSIQPFLESYFPRGEIIIVVTGERILGIKVKSSVHLTGCYLLSWT